MRGEDVSVRVEVDREACVGAGSCVRWAASVFAQDEDGTVVLLDSTPPVEVHEAVREAILVCPAYAISEHEAPNA